MEDFFRQLAAEAPRWNFIFFYDERSWNRIVEGLYYTLILSVACVILSVVIGVVGAWAQGSPSRLLRNIVQGYIQFFRNTPPFVQLLFFYFALGQFTPTYSPDGWLQVPIISNVGWAIISLSFFAGAFNVEIFRAGIEAVPDSTREAAEALVEREQRADVARQSGAEGTVDHAASLPTSYAAGPNRSGNTSASDPHDPAQVFHPPAERLTLLALEAARKPGARADGSLSCPGRSSSSRPTTRRRTCP